MKKNRDNQKIVQKVTVVVTATVIVIVKATVTAIVMNVSIVYAIDVQIAKLVLNALNVEVVNLTVKIVMNVLTVIQYV